MTSPAPYLVTIHPLEEVDVDAQYHPHLVGALSGEFRIADPRRNRWLDRASPEQRRAAALRLAALIGVESVRLAPEHGQWHVHALSF